MTRTPSALDSAKLSDAARGEVNAGELERRKLTGRAGVVALGTLSSRVLGLGRDQVLAAVFTRAATDAFFIAFTIPNVLRQLLAEGAVQSAVLPVLTETREHEGEPRAREFFAKMRGLSLILAFSTSVAGVFAAPELVLLFADGFKDVPGQFERTVTLTRWVFPYIFFMATAALGVAALNTHHRFVATSFAPALLNVAFIACSLALPSMLARAGYEPILAMAIGALIGGVLQVIAQWPSLYKIGYLTRPRFDLKDQAVRRVLWRMTPVLAGIGVYAIDVTLARRFLSELPVGAQSYFAFAQRLCDFPQGIFVMALQSATLPSLARLAARKDATELAKTFTFGLQLALFVGVAATALFVGLAEPLVAAIFQRGHFDQASTRQTADALIAQGLGIWMVAAVRQLVGAYYALGDTRTPVIVAALDLCAFIAAALALRGPLGHVGISLAVTIASAVQMTLLWVGLRRRLVCLHFAEVCSTLLKTSLAAGLAVVVARFTLRQFGPERHAGDGARIAIALAAVSCFGVVFLASALMLKSSELRTLTDGFRRRARRAS